MTAFLQPAITRAMLSFLPYREKSPAYKTFTLLRAFSGKRMAKKFQSKQAVLYSLQRDLYIKYFLGKSANATIAEREKYNSVIHMTGTILKS